MSIKLDELPAEIIDLIADHLRQDSEAVQSIAVRRKHCPCIRLGEYATTDETWQEEKPDDSYRDGAMHLSMTCKLLRGIVFAHVVRRKIRGGLCYDSWIKTRKMPECLRRTVKVLEIVTRPMHTPTPCRISLNDYLRHLPSLDRLIINWSFPVSNIHPAERSDAAQVSHLTLVMQRSAYNGPGPYAVPIAYHMSRILEYLTLPRLKSLVIEFSFKTSDFVDSQANWQDNGSRLMAIAKFAALEDVEIKLRVYVERQAFTPLNFKLQRIVIPFTQVSGIKQFRLCVDYEIDGFRSHPFRRDVNRPGMHTLHPFHMLDAQQCDGLLQSMTGAALELESFELAILASMAPARSGSELFRLLSYRADSSAGLANAETRGTYDLDVEAMQCLHRLHPWSKMHFTENDDADGEMASIVSSVET